MDPNACLDRLISAIDRRDWPEAREALDDIEGWLSRGGFPPEGRKLDQLQTVCERTNVPARTFARCLRLCQRFA